MGIVMEQSELLSEFKKKVDEFVKARSFVDKAQAQAEKFDSAVIQKVVESHTEKANGIVGSLLPLTVEVGEQIATLQGQKQEMRAGQESARLQLQELELRQVIGEMSKKQFESKSKSLKEELEGSDSQVSDLDEACASMQAELERWSEAAEKAGVNTESAMPVEAAIEVGEFEDGVHAESVSVIEDLAVVFEDEAPSGVPDEEVIEAIASDDPNDDDDDEVIEMGEADLDLLVDDDDDSLELDVAGIEAEEINGTGRRAVLLYLEGTSDELVHPVNTEVISMGRGRDNDIQVKNDSKVSRYHCKIYSRGPNYYIEDNKSANGSLVNGELITERRLFGGEEIIIGETFYRFRILD